MYLHTVFGLIFCLGVRCLCLFLWALRCLVFYQVFIPSQCLLMRCVRPSVSAAWACTCMRACIVLVLKLLTPLRAFLHRVPSAKCIRKHYTLRHVIARVPFSRFRFKSWCALFCSSKICAVKLCGPKHWFRVHAKEDPRIRAPPPSLVLTRTRTLNL